MKMIFQAFKKRGWRKVKEKGTIKLTAEERSNLERLGKDLSLFCEWFKTSGRVLSNSEMVAVIDAEHLIDTLSLILSEDTDYGYFKEQGSALLKEKRSI